MRARTWTDFIIINLLTLLLIIATVSFPSNVLRIVLGIPFVLFFPGYILMSALFPRKASIDNLQRVALSLGMSIAIVPLIGLILNYTPWGITLESVLSSTTTFIVIMSVVAWIRRRQFPEGERFGIGFHLSIPGWGGSIWDRTLTVVLAVSVLGTMAAVGYTIATPKEGERFTEFYMLGAYGEAVDYPRSVTVGHEVDVTVAIVNQEGEVTDYRVEIGVNGTVNNELDGLVIESGEMWQGEISFVPNVPGNNQKVELFLFKNGETEPYMEPLCLLIDVNS